jgi:hypothetical protein
MQPVLDLAVSHALAKRILDLDVLLNCFSYSVCSLAVDGSPLAGRSWQNWWLLRLRNFVWHISTRFSNFLVAKPLIQGGNLVTIILFQVLQLRHFLIERIFFNSSRFHILFHHLLHDILDFLSIGLVPFAQHRPGFFSNGIQSNILHPCKALEDRYIRFRNLLNFIIK